MIMIIIINCPQAVQAEKYKDKIFGFFLALLCKEGQSLWYYSFFLIIQNFASLLTI